MKRISLLIILSLIALAFCFSATFTEEEFYEVYDALVESNELLKAKEVELNELNENMNKLVELNQKLTEQLESAEQKLIESQNSIEKLNIELQKTTNRLETLSNQKILLGGLLGFNDISILENNTIGFGIGINIGYKIWIGYLSTEVIYFNDKTVDLALSYSLVF